MKRFLKSKKGLALLATLVVVGASAIGAYAYLTDGGSGSGSATAGSVTNNLKITGDGVAAPVVVGSGLLPGNSVSVTYYITNPNDYSVQVSSVSGTTSQSVPGCESLNGDFSYTDGSNGYPKTIDADTTAGPFTGTLAESDDPSTNQDACESPNSTTLSLTSS